MQEKAVSILKDNRIMAIATVRADGWPQTTTVSYASDELLIYFSIATGAEACEHWSVFR
jgi:nitroimidazol reductase NimA-like FMN-containing flavoprotein (pyridoxamine 5'-phosphate oxidase superfamily)